MKKQKKNTKEEKHKKKMSLRETYSFLEQNKTPPHKPNFFLIFFQPEQQQWHTITTSTTTKQQHKQQQKSNTRDNLHFSVFGENICIMSSILPLPVSPGTYCNIHILCKHAEKSLTFLWVSGDGMGKKGAEMNKAGREVFLFQSMCGGPHRVYSGDRKFSETNFCSLFPSPFSRP